jgi:UPF0716 family protein affecting phage T7 exclusion
VVSRRRRISPQAAARRSLLIDGLVAIGLVVLAFQLAAGVGIVGVLALLALLVLTASIGIEAVLRRRRPGAERLRESMRDG